jgi:hypothetical protein
MASVAFVTTEHYEGDHHVPQNSRKHLVFASDNTRLLARYFCGASPYFC